MKIGICTSYQNLPAAAALGYDYAELAVTDVVSLSADALELVKNSPIPVETFNCLFPGDLGLILGRDEDIRAYLREAFARLNYVGGSLSVFGSGGARRIPEGVPYGQAFRRLVEVTRLIGDMAAEYGLAIAVEPLRFPETNIVNTLSEGAALVAMTDRPNVGLLADTYHVWCNGEPVSRIGVIKDFRHIHISAADRSAPIPEELPLYREFIGQLQAAGYNGRISVECSMKDFQADAARGLEVMRSL